MNEQNDIDVFDDDLFATNGNEGAYPTIGRWGIIALHIMKAAFVLYSGAHNIQASILATGDGAFAIVAQIVGVLILEASIAAIYMAGMGRQITGRLQAVLAALTWVIGMALASAGIVADSRLHAGYELGSLLEWHLSTGLFVAPVIMVVGLVLVVFSDPVLLQHIANARDRAQLQRDRVLAQVISEKAQHTSQKIVHNIRLGAQKQMAIEARKYYKSDAIQGVLKETAVKALHDVMRQAGIPAGVPLVGGQNETNDLPLVANMAAEGQLPTISVVTNLPPSKSSGKTSEAVGVTFATSGKNETIAAEGDGVNFH